MKETRVDSSKFAVMYLLIVKPHTVNLNRLDIEAVKIFKLTIRFQKLRCTQQSSKKDMESEGKEVVGKFEPSW